MSKFDGSILRIPDLDEFVAKYGEAFADRYVNGQATDEEIQAMVDRGEVTVQMIPRPAPMQEPVLRIIDEVVRGAENVLGLPCFCDTPQLHSTACERLRALVSKIRFEVEHPDFGKIAEDLFLRMDRMSPAESVTAIDQVFRRYAPSNSDCLAMARELFRRVDSIYAATAAITAIQSALEEVHSAEQSR